MMLMARKIDGLKLIQKKGYMKYYGQAEQRDRGEKIWEEALARTKAAGEETMQQRY